MVQTSNYDYEWLVTLIAIEKRDYVENTSD